MVAPAPRTAAQLMAPLPPPAATGRWGIFIPGPTDEGCLCTDPGLGGGHQSSAHVVLAPPAGENLRYIVRKIRKNTYTDRRIEDRADREVRICNEIERRIAFGALPRPNIVRLIEAMDIPGDPERQFWRRSTFWDWCNMGSTLKLCDAYAAENAVAPPYILARYLRQGLEVINWLLHPGLYRNANAASIFHNDMHAGNIFVNWDNEEEGPNFFVGDFGFARQAGEPRPINTQELSEMSPTSRLLMSSPRDSSVSPAPSTPLAVDGGPAREEWDVQVFLLAFNTTEDSLLRPYNAQLRRGPGPFPPVPAIPDTLLAILRDLETMDEQDQRNSQGIQSMWPGYQDLTEIIGRLRQFENAEKALHDAAGNAFYLAHNATQRRMFAAHMARVRQSQRPVQENFEYDAAAVVRSAGIPYPFAIVNCNDPDNLAQTQQAMAEFVADPPAPSLPTSPMDIDFERSAITSTPPRPGFRFGYVDSITSNPVGYGLPQIPAYPPQTPQRLAAYYPPPNRANTPSPNWSSPARGPPVSPTPARGTWLPRDFPTSPTPAPRRGRPRGPRRAPY